MSARTENCKRRVFCDEPAYKCLTSCAMFEEFPVDAKEENARLRHHISAAMDEVRSGLYELALMSLDAALTGREGK